MIVTNVRVKNFGSYKELEFNFSTSGLHLISGPTGSGKSTVCDLIPWVLFGKTAKNGLADEVRTWGSEEDAVGSVTLLRLGREYRFYRSRGRTNDLYFEDQDGTQRRGKDLKDTQRIINEMLNTSAEQYLASSYYHELSTVANFFQATAKGRKQLTEQICDLTEVTKAQEFFAYKQKMTKQLLSAESAKQANTTTSLVMTKKIIQTTESKLAAWDREQLENRSYLESKALSFDSEVEVQAGILTDKIEKWRADRQQNTFKLNAILDDLLNKQAQQEKRIAQLTFEKARLSDSSVCDHCGAQTNSVEIQSLSDSILLASKELGELNLKISRQKSSLDTELALQNPHEKTLEMVLASKNPYLVDLEKLVFREKNPFLEQLNELRVSEASLQEDYENILEVKDLHTKEFAALESAKKAAEIARNMLLEATISAIEQETNSILETYFESIARVSFKVLAADELDVSITKDGNLCTFAQLSKGQRQILKLSFGVACMKAIGNTGTSKWNQIFFDEAFDGLDDNFKIKAFSLLEALSQEYDSVYVVEHNEELKTRFASRYEVSTTDGFSQVRKIV